MLAIATVVAIVAARWRVPEAVPLVALGALVGSIAHVRPPFAFGPTLLFVFLPPLVFEAAWNIDLRALRTYAGRVALLALPGTLVCAASVAIAVSIARSLPLPAALLLGAIVSATDPIAVVAIFRRIGVPVGLKTIVEAESLANDGVAVVLYGIALALASGTPVDLLAAGSHGVLAIGLGIACGVACAVPLWWLLRSASAAEHEVTATLALAYAAYLAADRLGLSGIFATASAAIVLRGLLHRVPHMENRDDVDRFWTSLAFLANATIFLATGLAIDVPRALHEPVLVVAALGGLALSRIALSAIVVREKRARITVFLAGMRGALPLALALALPEALAHRSEIVDGVFAVVLVTLVVQGAPLGPILARLYPPARTP
ncbi:MAG: cation:proton antiporter [Vulcanimicrobiaceae bacterium]